MLPLTRNTNYGAGVQVKSFDLNDMQDRIIAAHNGAKNSQVLNVNLRSHFILAGAWTDNGSNLVTGAALAQLEWHIPGLIVGDRILGVTVHCKDVDGANYLRAQLLSYDKYATPLTSSGLVDSDKTGANQDLVLTGIVPALVTAGQQWLVNVDTIGGAGNRFLYSMSVTIDHP